MAREDLDRKIAALKLLGKTVRFNHQQETGPDRRIGFVSWNGMVGVDGMAGEFAPHLFQVVDQGQE